MNLHRWTTRLVSHGNLFKPGLPECSRCLGILKTGRVVRSCDEQLLGRTTEQSPTNFWYTATATSSSNVRPNESWVITHSDGEDTW